LPFYSLQLRSDFDVIGLRKLARGSRDPDPTRRLLALAEIYDGGARSDAAWIGGGTKRSGGDFSGYQPGDPYNCCIFGYIRHNWPGARESDEGGVRTVRRVLSAACTPPPLSRRRPGHAGDSHRRGAGKVDQPAEAALRHQDNCQELACDTA
jgi:hypothetical protein